MHPKSKEEIVLLLGNGDLGSALDLFQQEASTPELKNLIVLQKNRWNASLRRAKQGLAQQESHQVLELQVVETLLQMLNGELPSREGQVKEEAKKFYDIENIQIAYFS